MEKKLEFTNRAKSQIEKVTKSGGKKYFRITVQGGGCSGFKYNFSVDNILDKDDILFDQTVIDKSSLEIIAGSTDVRVYLLVSFGKNGKFEFQGLEANNGDDVILEVARIAE